jgi:hypothetical protein
LFYYISVPFVASLTKLASDADVADTSSGFYFLWSDESVSYRSLAVIYIYVFILMDYDSYMHKSSARVMSEIFFKYVMWCSW